jgi:predicted 2-oxoglutarate/Fe(II)-dependent dioxygenase YbiX/peroxiredoxin
MTMLPTDGAVPSGVGMTAAAGLARGERAPDMVLPSRDGTPTRYYAHAGGRPALLVFADEACVARLDALAEGLTAIDEAHLTVHVVGPPALAGHDLPFPLLQDADGRAVAAYRTGAAPTVFLLDPNLRIRATLPFADGARIAADVAELVGELIWDDPRPREITTQAPLLVVPDVLGPEHCAELIAVWEREGHSDTGVESSTGGRRAEQRSAQLKRRRDHIVQDPQRSRELGTTIGRRVMPELSKAFAYRASRFEGFKIACYQASDRGFFRAHRDNLSPATAHRRFALTLNLNDGYEGGQLRFPEYGPELYRPATGAALLFSCSHLHEVLDVTAGRRFVLLSFLFGDEVPRPE